MKKLLAGLAVAGLLAIATPAAATPVPANTTRFPNLKPGQNAAVHIFGAEAGTWTAHVTFAPVGQGTFNGDYQLILGGPNGVTCAVANYPSFGDAPTAQPMGEWSCAITTGGNIHAYFWNRTGDPLTGTLSLELT